jgi:hypothetical protein
MSLDAKKYFYASTTNTKSGKTQESIRDFLESYGAEDIHYGESSSQAFIAFKYDDIPYVLILPLPTLENVKKEIASKRRRGKNAVPENTRKQLVNSAWRSLFLRVKVNIDNVNRGIMTFPEAFLPSICLPGGRTLADEVIPRLGKILISGRLEVSWVDEKKLLES